METFTLASAGLLFAGALITGLAAWIWKRIGKIEDNADKAGQAITAEEARKIITEEIKKQQEPLKAEIKAIKVEQEDTKREQAVMRSDIKGVGVSILEGVKNQETRLDQLFMHLLTRGDKQ